MFPSSAWLASKNRPVHPEWDAEVAEHPDPKARRYPRQSSLSMGLPMPRVVEESPEKPKIEKPSSFHPASVPYKQDASRNISGSSFSQTGTSSSNSDSDERRNTRYMPHWRRELQGPAAERGGNHSAYNGGAQNNTNYGHVVAPVANPNIAYTPTYHSRVYTQPKNEHGAIGGERIKAVHRIEKKENVRRDL